MIDEIRKAELRSGLKAYVESITQPDRRAGANMYKCPLCGSGQHGGRNSDGAFSVTKDGLAWKCFSCGKGGDIFTLIGLYEGLDDFKDQARRAAEIGGFSLPSEYTRKAETPKNTMNTDFTGEARKYVAACQAAAGKTDYFKKRGFSSEIVQRFGLGYDERAGVIVIPYDQTGSYYSTRSVTDKVFRKPSSSEAGAEPIYNGAALRQKKPCFVCEAPLDAISIIAAGSGKCNAIALGGTGHRKLIEQVEKETPACTLVLSFDSDEAGEKARDAAAEELSAHNVPFIVAAYSLEAYPEGSRKDGNDFFRSNPGQLEADIAANVEEVERRANAEKLERLEAHNASSGAARLQDFIGGIKEAANTAYIPTGFSELDKELDGGLYPGLYILGAISSLGKTTFLLQLADQIAAAGYDILYFSLEMAASELISKSLSRLTFLHCDGQQGNAKTARGITTASRYQGYSRDEKALIEKAIGLYGEYAGNLYIYEGIGDIGVDRIKELVAEHRELTGRTPLIFIDYLQILAPYELRATDKQNTDKAVLELKRLSRDYKAVVVAISSFNRDSYTNEVNMAAFKESGAIEYGSDVLLAMQPQGMKPGYTKTEQKANVKLVSDCKRAEVRSVEVKVLKNRNGKTGGRVGFDYYSLFNCLKQDYGFKLETEDDFVEIDGEETPWDELETI